MNALTAQTSSIMDCMHCKRVWCVLHCWFQTSTFSSLNKTIKFNRPDQATWETDLIWTASWYLQLQIRKSAKYPAPMLSFLQSSESPAYNTERWRRSHVSLAYYCGKRVQDQTFTFVAVARVSWHVPFGFTTVAFFLSLKFEGSFFLVFCLIYKQHNTYYVGVTQENHRSIFILLPTIKP